MAYFSNSSEGSVLDDQCCDCPLGSGWNSPDQPTLFTVGTDYEPPGLRPCPVAFVQMQFNYDQVTSENKGDETARKIMDALVTPLDFKTGKGGVCKVREQLMEIRSEANHV